MMMRAIAFFYHLSLSIHFTVWTELLLDDFNGDYSKASDFLGCVPSLVWVTERERIFIRMGLIRGLKSSSIST
jgi:hypothetical protein